MKALFAGKSWRRAAMALALAVAAATPLRAQVDADSAALATAVTEMVADSLVTGLSRYAPLYLAPPRTPFDQRVTQALRQAYGLADLSPAQDTAQWIVTHGVTLNGDSADVLLEIGVRNRGGSESDIDGYVETRRYRFIRAGAGWRFLSQEFVRGADFGSVRG